MEHLFEPSELDKARLSLLSHPWLGFDHDSQSTYPIAAFEDYPTLRGWSKAQIQALRQPGTNKMSLTSAVPMLQSLLFFGVLESTFQEHFSTSLFVREEQELSESSTDAGACGVRLPISSQRRLDTTYLATYYQNWLLAFPKMTAERKAQLYKSRSEALNAAWDWIMFLHSSLRPQMNTDERLTALVCAALRPSILLLEFVSCSFPSPDNAQHTSLNLSSISMDDDGEIHRRLEARRWCPSSFELIGEKLGLSGLLYATCLNPTELLPVSHDTCTKKECFAYNIDIATYRPEHACEAQTCEPIIPPIDEIYEALRSNTFPLINGQKLLAGASSIHGYAVTPYREGIEFIAFSHVWSDGHGSVTERGLPRCHIEFLSHLAKLEWAREPRQTPPLFWIDSLCVPEKTELRTDAIHRMAKVYGEATVTLVLDTGLRICSSTQPVAEVALRIITSVWMRRVWTLQEALLARNLTFLLKDTLLPLDQLLWQILQPACLGPISARALVELVAFRGNNYSTKPAHISHILTLLRWRTTSRLDDETLAIAPLLHLDVKRLTPHQGELRVLEFWNCLESVPIRLLFVPAERFSTRGRRWAIQRLTTVRDTMLASPLARITERALVGVFTVLKLEQRQHLKGERLYALCDIVSRRSFFISLSQEEADSFDTKGGLPCDMLALEHDRLHESSVSALILARDNGGRNGEPVQERESFEIIARMQLIQNESGKPVDWDSLAVSGGVSSHTIFDAIAVHSIREEITIT
jgi:Heterokaryon incompatibility protein (HET)